MILYFIENCKRSALSCKSCELMTLAKKLYLYLISRQYLMFTILLNTEARDLLRTWREDSERRSRDVVDFWENTLMNKIDHLGNESMINRSIYTYTALLKRDRN